MKNWRGLWLPDGETHLIEWMEKVNQVVDGKPTYQLDKQQMAMKWVRNWRVAVDVGAHCGLWSMHLVKRFEETHAFEPVEDHRECFMRNVGEGPVELYPYALGEQEGKVAIHTSETSSGDSWVDGEGDIPMKRLDDFGFQDVDFIKLDCEGYELFALKGAEETLKRCRPCVCVEQKPGRAQKFGLGETDAVDYMRSLGAHLRAAKSGDYIMAWDV
jgi:FkbM family methyltransferase